MTAARHVPPPPVLPSRRMPSFSLPAYRYVPGVLPHPFRDPDGHDHLARLPLPDVPWAPGQLWPACVHHRYAIDLFDHRFYWESHEVWEAVWLRLPRPSAERELIQALIQVAAATLKRHMGSPRASATLLARAQARLQTARREGPVVCGVDVDQMRARLAPPLQWPTVPLADPRAWDLPVGRDG